MSDNNNVYTILGGKSPGVAARAPFLSRAREAPIMPIVIKSTNSAEAQAALGLDPILKRLHVDTVDQQPETVAVAIAHSDQISDVFAPRGPFYAVYNGKTERAIYVRNFTPDVQAQVHDHLYAKHHRFESIKEALVYMVLKGNLQKMQELGLYPNSKPTSPTAPVQEGFQKQKKTGPIDSHIRDFAGILNTVYGSTTAPAYKLYNLGKHAGYYLQAHGYTEPIILQIEEIYLEAKDVESFVKSLTSQGMAAAEVRWLWDLIRHDDNCGN
ncbi:hypothetical protein C8R47DRAFT_1230301 [Mycena vitilis]|nr:hypothetical protein C8R47DRAFT_1230301 [Mycena vitilis]